MKTNSQKQQKSETIIEKQLKRIHINKIARQTGFYKRMPKKIKAKNLLISFLMVIWGSKKNTYSVWANKLGLLINDTVSKQAIAKRINKELVAFLRDMLKIIMKRTVPVGVKEITSDKLKIYNRILLEDSTSIRLEDRYAKDYPSARRYGKEPGILKIQTVYEILKKQFLNFEITRFTENDQGYAGKILNIVSPGDLLIRDLGYFVLGILKKLAEKGVFFISLAKKEVKIYLKREDEPIDLAKMLKKRGNLDIQVFLGKEEKLPVRLIAIPVDQEVASTRIRKARKEYRWVHKKDYYFLLRWNLLITNIAQEQISSTDIYRIYSLRWRIEIIFKSWKSSLGIKKVPKDGNQIRLEAYIYCMLIFILLFQVNYYNYYIKEICRDRDPKQSQLSLLKFMNFMVSNLNLFIDKIYFKSMCLNKLLKKQIIYHCLYELRTDRVNFNQVLVNLG